MKHPLVSILFSILTLSASDAQETLPPSSVPTSVATSSAPSSSELSQNPSIAPISTSEPSTTKPSLSQSPSPTSSYCTNTPGWFFESWDYSRASCSSSWEYTTLRLDCDDERVDCLDYGSSGFASENCCKCKWKCTNTGQCAEPITEAPTPFNSDDCFYYPTNNDYYYDDYYNDDDDSFITTFTGIAMVACCCIACILGCCHEENQQDARLEANRQTMAARRQQQRESNSQGLTEEERNHARYAIFVANFHFQTVTADKSNISASSMRSSEIKPTEENPNEEKHNADDASAIGTITSERSLRMSLTRRLSSWRRPSAKDECCICLEPYVAGETICAPVTTDCNHVFHEGCILQWVKNNDKCPLCRIPVMTVRRSDNDVHA